VNNELETMWKETVIALFKALPQHTPGETDWNFDKQSRQPVFWPRFKPSIFQIRSRCANRRPWYSALFPSFVLLHLLSLQKLFPDEGSLWHTEEVRARSKEDACHHKTTQNTWTKGKLKWRHSHSEWPPG
jgi:hypothetical protein